MRKIYYAVPKYNLSHYVNCQMELFTQKPDNLLSRSPRVVTMILSHLKTLHVSNVVSKKKVLASFFDLNDSELFEHSWGPNLEARLSAAKESINLEDYLPSKESDVRILSQCLLDFLESLSPPAVSEHTLSQFEKQELAVDEKAPLQRLVASD